MTNPRMRMTAIAGSMALAMSLAATPAMAQDDPADTFTDFAEAFQSMDLVALPTFFCAEQADSLGGIGMADLATGVPTGMEFLLDAISIDFQIESVEVLSQSETEAVVDVAATAAMEFDIEAVMPVLAGMLEGLGASEEEIEQLQAEMAAEIPEAETLEIAGEITMVPGEERAWVICSDLDSLAVDGMDDGMDEDEMDGEEDGE